MTLVNNKDTYYTYDKNKKVCTSFNDQIWTYKLDAKMVCQIRASDENGNINHESQHDILVFSITKGLPKMKKKS